MMAHERSEQDRWDKENTPPRPVHTRAISSATRAAPPAASSSLTLQARGILSFGRKRVQRGNSGCHEPSQPLPGHVKAVACESLATLPPAVSSHG